MCEAAIKMFDKVSIEIHFIRYFYLVFFTNRKAETLFTKAVMVDLAIFVLAILPAFVIAMRFWTAPVYLNYRLRINAIIVPFLIPLLFVCQHWDLV